MPKVDPQIQKALYPVQRPLGCRIAYRLIGVGVSFEEETIGAADRGSSQESRDEVSIAPAGAIAREFRQSRIEGFTQGRELFDVLFHRQVERRRRRFEKSSRSSRRYRTLRPIRTKGGTSPTRRISSRDFAATCNNFAASSARSSWQQSAGGSGFDTARKRFARRRDRAGIVGFLRAHVGRERRAVGALVVPRAGMRDGSTDSARRGACQGRSRPNSCYNGVRCKPADRQRRETARESRPRKKTAREARRDSIARMTMQELDVLRGWAIASASARAPVASLARTFHCT